jgi:hypothetical protein
VKSDKDAETSHQGKIWQRLNDSGPTFAFWTRQSDASHYFPKQPAPIVNSTPKRDGRKISLILCYCKVLLLF